MKKVKLGLIVATREFDFATSLGRKGKVLVRIGRPRHSADGEFCCPYQIIGLGRERVRCAFGVDSVQAIQFALGMVGADLSALNKSVDHGLRWLNSSSDLGFPHSEP